MACILNVECDGSAAVPQPGLGLDHLWRYPLFEDPGSKGVTCIVESDRRQASLGEYLAEIAVQGMRVNEFTVSLTNDQTVSVIGLSEPQFFLRLAGPVLT
jgi:hypothetical protein